MWSKIDEKVIIVLVSVRAFRIYVLFLSLNYFEKPIFVINIDWSDVIKNGWKSDHCTCLSESFQNIYTFSIFTLFWKTHICDQYRLIRSDQKWMKKWSLYLSEWELSEYIHFPYLLIYFEKPIFLININWSDLIKNGWKSDHCTCLIESFQNIYTFPIRNLFWKNQYLRLIDQICMIEISQYYQKLIKKVSLYFSHWELSEYT